MVSGIDWLLCASECEEGGRRPAGRAGGCAEAPRAGLPPYGLPSLTRNGRSRRTRQLPSLRKLRRIRVGPFAEQPSGGQIHFRSRQKDGGCSRCQSDQHCIHWTKDVHPGSPCLSVMEQPRSRMGFPWFGCGLPRSTRKGFATQACDLFGFAYEVTAAAPEHVGACRAGMVPAARREPFNVAQSHPRSEPRL